MQRRTLLLRGGAGCQQTWGEIFLLFYGLGKPGTHQAEVLISLFHTTCVKAAAVKQP